MKNIFNKLFIASFLFAHLAWAGTFSVDQLQANGVTAQTLTSTVATGTPPLTVTSTTPVPNLTATNATNATNASMQPSGTSNTSIANTAFVNPGSTSSYRKNPDGTIDEWGTCTASTNVAASCVVTFPIAFTTAVYSVQGTAYDNGGAGSAVGGVSEHIASRTLSGTALNLVGLNGAYWNGTIEWRAIGK